MKSSCILLQKLGSEGFTRWLVRSRIVAHDMEPDSGTGYEAPKSCTLSPSVPSCPLTLCIPCSSLAPFAPSHPSLSPLHPCTRLLCLCTLYALASLHTLHPCALTPLCTHTPIPLTPFETLLCRCYLSEGEITNDDFFTLREYLYSFWVCGV